MEKESYKIVIIDPSSPEMNRGSFCYMPYLYYSALNYKEDVDLFEDFTIPEIDDLPPAEEYHVALWSYPQIDACLVLNKFLPGKKKFFGYTPLIKALKLPLLELSGNIISKGMANYPQAYGHFRHLLLSDCDMHLTKYKDKVYPLFTSYGCPRGCAFCPSTVNQKVRIHLHLDEVKSMLRQCYSLGVKAIHFTDEDFFYDIDRAHEIIEYATKFGFKLIALGEVRTVTKYIQKYNTTSLHAGGMKLIEIGMETADEELGKKMGKAPIVKCQELADMCDIPIFWLALTFFPGETLKTLNTTGQFLKRYGFNPDELYGRIRTNGTEGGLGQFFQPYHGTKQFKELKGKGKFISSRPIRLIPSYLPDSFLSNLVQRKRRFKPSDDKWFKLYGLNINQFEYLREDKNVLGNINTLRRRYSMTTADAAIGIALCARLQII